MSLRSASVVVVSVLSLAACAVGSFSSEATDGALGPGPSRSEDDASVDARTTPSSPGDGAADDDGSVAASDGAIGADARAADASDARAADATADATLDASTDATVDASTDATVGTARAPAPGDLVISEIAYDPAGTQPDSEWFEVASLASVPIELRGVTLRDGVARTHVVASSVVVPPGGFVVLARLRAAVIAGGVPASAIGYEYGAGLGSSSGVLLANGSTGAIELVSGGGSLVRVAYGAFGLNASNGSLELRVLGYQASPGASAYCAQATPTPGAAPRCP